LTQEDNPFDEPTPEFVSSENSRLEVLVLNEVEDHKTLELILTLNISRLENRADFL